MNDSGTNIEDLESTPIESGFHNGEVYNIGFADVGVSIAGNTIDEYDIPSEMSRVESYVGEKGGPVIIKSNNGTKIIASTQQLRRRDFSVDEWTGIAQIIGTQAEGLSDKFVLPYYSHTDPSKYEVVLIANFDSFDTYATVKVGSSSYGPYLVEAGNSYIFVQWGLEGGPVVVTNNNGAKMVASLYQLKRPGTWGPWNGQSEMVGIPLTKLSDTYVFPFYDYTTPGLLPSLKFAAP